MDLPLDLSKKTVSISQLTQDGKCTQEEYKTNASEDIGSLSDVQLTYKLSYTVARKILDGPDCQQVLTEVPKGRIKMNTIYVYDTSMSNHAYWQDDRKSWTWRRARMEPMRSKEKIVFQRQYKLRHNGEEVHCFRDEIWDLSGDPIQPMTWNPPRVVVFHRGTSDVNEAVNKRHGNFGKPKSVKKLFNPCSSKTAWIKNNFEFVAVETENTHSSAPEISDGFVSTPKSTKDKIDEMLKQKKMPAVIQRQMNLAEIYDDTGSVEGPRDKKQVKNRSQALKDPTFHRIYDLEDVYAFGIDHIDIIRRLDLLPGLLVVARHPELEAHFMELYAVNRYMFLFYDTTFNLGNRLVSILTVRHPGLLQNPAYPLSLLYHEYTDKKFTHAPFLQTVSNDLCKLNTAKTVICTDREASIKAAVAQVLPKATHIFCYIHMLNNVNGWVVRNFKNEDRKYYYLDVKRLLWCESILEYESVLNSFCGDDDGIETRETA